MFPTPNNYGQVPRIPMSSSSFYIRDILGNDNGFNDTGKFTAFEAGNYFQNYPTTSNISTSMLTYPHLSYPAPTTFRGKMFQFLVFRIEKLE